MSSLRNKYGGLLKPPAESLGDSSFSKGVSLFGGNFHMTRICQNGFPYQPSPLVQDSTNFDC